MSIATNLCLDIIDYYLYASYVTLFIFKKRWQNEKNVKKLNVTKEKKRQHILYIYDLNNLHTKMLILVLELDP